jgi:replicative DNA helicase
MTKELFASDSEIAILSIIGKNPEFIFNIDGLKPFMFNSTIHNSILINMLELSNKNLLPDFSLLYSSLESNDKLMSCGGKEYIEYLSSQVYNKENFSEHLRIVKNNYKIRSFVSLSSGITTDSLTVDNVDSNILAVQNSLENLESSVGGEGTYQIGSLLNDAYKEIVTRIEKPGIRGVSFGSKKVDTITGGLCPGDLWYVAGRPSSGKTASAINTILDNAKNNVPTLLFSKEMSRQPLIERMLAIKTGLPIFNIRMGLLKQPELDLLYNATKELKEQPIHIDLSFSSNIDQMEAVIRKYKSLHDIKVVYIDYVQLMVERDNNQTQELGRVSRRLKLMANTLDMTMVVLSQLNREVEHRDNKRPVMSDIRQCGNLEEDADFVVGLYRDEYYNKDTKDKGKLEFIILKQRNGPTGTTILKFNAETNQIRDD